MFFLVRMCGVYLVAREGEAFGGSLYIGEARLGGDFVQTNGDGVFVARSSWLRGGEDPDHDPVGAFV